MKKLLLIILILSSSILFAQQKVYRAERTKINDLIHTKLKVSFNFKTSQMYGEAWVTLKPHFYPTNKVVLDAKAFTIKTIKVNNKVAPYNYSDNQITIELGKTYQKDEKYTVYVNYIANPEKVKQSGSSAITEAKGLYFIDPKEEDPEKPTEIWTQGETESNSCWFPTIDSPNQKSTEEIYMTVPNKFVTLSNGKLISKTVNTNGTRTDYWKMDQQHAPYLFFMGAGEFSVVKDSLNHLPVNYYVEKEYAPVAKKIFGHTPEMIDFFSKITGVPYQWNKYDQIVVRDYVSGAMENTTAVVHGESAQQKEGQLIDENIWENTISHELFHHWFGDLVTTESWSNLTLNESFATYGEYLWLKHKYGEDAANENILEDAQLYLGSKKDDKKNLVRFYYKDREDMFDLVSYQKGAVILHMLNDYLGDKAFFAGLKDYLLTNKYGTAEATNLRLSMEKVSGRDLNWFFNEWYYGNGHIKMDVTYDYNTINKTVTVNIKQKEKTFTFPLSIDVYEGGHKERHEVWVSNADESFTFSFDKLPNLVNVDAKKVLLAEIKDTKTIENYIFQYNHSSLYQDRIQALKEIVANQNTNKTAYLTLLKALNDQYYKIRIYALKHIDLFQKWNKKDAIYKIVLLAKTDSKTLVKAEAIKVLGKLVDPVYTNIFKNALNSKSFAMNKSALVGLYQVDTLATLQKIKKLSSEQKENLADAITRIYIEQKDTTQYAFVAKHIISGMFDNDVNTQRIYGLGYQQLIKSNDIEAFRNLTNRFVVLGKKYRKYKFDKMAVNLMNQIVTTQINTKNSNKDAIILILRKGIAQLLE
ncbi:MAG: M1 family aminopeptidase [Lutibacter sp.]